MLFPRSFFVTGKIKGAVKARNAEPRTAPPLITLDARFGFRTPMCPISVSSRTTPFTPLHQLHRLAVFPLRLNTLHSILNPSTLPPLHTSTSAISPIPLLRLNTHSILPPSTFHTPVSSPSPQHHQLNTIPFSHPPTQYVLQLLHLLHFTYLAVDVQAARHPTGTSSSSCATTAACTPTAAPPPPCRAPRR